MRVPTYEPRQLASVPTVRQSVETNPDMFGAGIGRGIAAAGQGFSEMASGIANYQERRNVEADRLAAMEATYKTTEKVQGLQLEYLNLQGKDAVDKHDEYMANVEKAQLEGLQHLTPRQQALTRQFQLQQHAQLSSQFASHAKEQGRKYEIGTMEGILGQTNQEAGLSANDKSAWESTRNKTLATAYSLAELQGLPPPKADEFVSKALDTHGKTIVDALTRNGDYAAAREFLDTHVLNAEVSGELKDLVNRHEKMAADSMLKQAKDLDEKQEEMVKEAFNKAKLEGVLSGNIDFKALAAIAMSAKTYEDRTKYLEDTQKFVDGFIGKENTAEQDKFENELEWGTRPLADLEREFPDVASRTAMKPEKIRAISARLEKARSRESAVEKNGEWLKALLDNTKTAFVGYYQAEPEAEKAAFDPTKPTKKEKATEKWVSPRAALLLGSTLDSISEFAKNHNQGDTQKYAEGLMLPIKENVSLRQLEQTMFRMPKMSMARYYQMFGYKQGKGPEPYTQEDSPPWQPSSAWGRNIQTNLMGQPER